MELTTKNYNKLVRRLKNGLMARYRYVNDDLLVSAVTDSVDNIIKGAKAYEDIEAYWVTCAWRRYIDAIRAVLRKPDKPVSDDENAKLDDIMANMPQVFSGLQIWDDLTMLPSLEKMFVIAILTNAIGVESTEKGIDHIRGKMRRWYLENISPSIRDYLKSYHICQKWMKGLA